MTNRGANSDELVRCHTCPRRPLAANQARRAPPCHQVPRRPTASANPDSPTDFRLNAPTSSTACPSPRSTSPMAFFNWKPAWSDPITIFIARSLSQRFFCCRNHVLNREAELFQASPSTEQKPRRCACRPFSPWAQRSDPSQMSKTISTPHPRRIPTPAKRFLCSRRILFFK